MTTNIIFGIIATLLITTTIYLISAKKKNTDNEQMVIITRVDPSEYHLYEEVEVL